MQSSSLSKVVLTSLAVTLMSSHGSVLVPDISYSTDIQDNATQVSAYSDASTSGAFTAINPGIELKVLRTNVKITKKIEKPLPKNVEPLVVEA